jgi:hypothetical protein
MQILGGPYREDGYFAFCRRAAEHPLGKDIKRADLMDNLDESRLEGIMEKDRIPTGTSSPSLSFCPGH